MANDERDQNEQHAAREERAEFVPTGEDSRDVAAEGQSADGASPGDAESAGSGPAEGELSDEALQDFLAAAAAEQDADAAKVEDAAGEDAPATGTQSAENDLAEERLNDLRRVQAEYANYRRRTEREQELSKDRYTAATLKSLLPVLDDIDRAEKHGDLEGDSPLTVIIAKLRGIVERTGLTPYGEAGEVFDPQRHEAIAQLPNPGVDGPTLADVVERGYTLGEQTVRVAKVAVFVPAE